MKKNIIKLNENQFRKIVAESVKKVLKEGGFHNEISYCPYCGSKKIEWCGDAFGDTEEKGTRYVCHECDAWFGIVS